VDVRANGARGGDLAVLQRRDHCFAKRFTWWPQLFLGLAFNWGVIVAYTAHAGWPGLPAILLYLAGIGWTLFYDTIYAHQDKEDDVLIGVKSTARLFGDSTGKWLAVFLVTTVVLMAGAIVAALLPDASVAQLGLGLIAPWAVGWHLWWQLRKLDTADPANCHRLFLSNRDTGLIAALFLALAAFL
jgi:4-hydroxybenzoate polyprenyltransferase